MLRMCNLTIWLLAFGLLSDLHCCVSSIQFFDVFDPCLWNVRTCAFATRANAHLRT